MADVTIKMIPNGPYRANGPFTIVDPKGNPISIEEGRSVSLCRCGNSANKPLRTFPASLGCWFWSYSG